MSVIPSPAASAPVTGSAAVARLKAIRERRSDWKHRAITTGISAAVHLLILLGCSLLVFDIQRIERIVALVTTFDEAETAPIIERSLLSPDEPAEDRTTSPISENFAAAASENTGPVDVNVNDLDLSVASSDSLDGVGLANIKFSDATSGRSAAARSALVKQYGGNSSSEASVASGLKWLATHQLEDGSWSFDHTLCKTCGGKCSQQGDMKECRIAATGLALLAYLGGGHTHEKGDYKKQVRGGVEALMKLGKSAPEGLDLRGELGNGHEIAAFYSHGIATIALSELVALSKDNRYRSSATNAVKFIVAAQDPKGGGWRYAPRQPGDTSVVGWQVMALKSAQNAKIKFPGVAFKGADLFLESMQSKDGSLYGYDNSMNPSPATTAAGLLCRMYLGWDRKQEGLQKGVEFLDKTKPQPNNMYFNYYATQVLHHWGGEEWTRWNNVMRDQLVSTQHPLEKGHSAGSWDVADPHGGAGGRHYMTCLAVMTLEVYYRHLPIYQRENIKVEF